MAKAVTMTEVGAVLATALAVRDCIRELGSVPSGHLYARLADRLSLEAYTQIINVLERSGVVKVENHLITYIGI